MIAAVLGAAVALVVGLVVDAGAVSSGRQVAAAKGKTYVVNSTKDTVDADVAVGACKDVHKKCTLRAAIQQANFHPGPDVVVIPAGTFKLTRKGNTDDADVVGDLDVTDSITLVGAGQGRTIIDGNGKKTGDRVLQVTGDATGTTIRDVTIRGGVRSATFDEGGGLLWEATSSMGGSLTLKNVTFTHDKSYNYGGFAVSGSTFGSDRIVLDHVTATHNTAQASAGGGGASLGNVGSFEIRHSVIRANHAAEAAGLYLQGPASDDTSLHVESTLFRGNKANLSGGLEVRGGTENAPVLVDTSNFQRNSANAAGGAMSNFGVLYVRRSTLEGNTTANWGGGIYDYEGGLTTFFNSTLYRNTADALGGGAFVEFITHPTGEVRFVNSTVAGNSAPTGGGMYARPGGAVVAATNTLFAHGASGENCVGNIGGQTSLSDDNSCGFGGGDDNVDLKLGPLGKHGGPTLTMVPLAGSPAVNAGTLAGEPVIDQRGVARPQSIGQDIGSVEVCFLTPPQPHALKAHRRDRGRRLGLKWKQSGCYQTFTVVVRTGSDHGKVVVKTTQLSSRSLLTKKLKPGTYFWQVQVVGDRVTIPSPYHRITLS